MESTSPLQKQRLAYQPKMPEAIRDLRALAPQKGEATTAKGHVEELKARFPHTFGQPLVRFGRGEAEPPRPLHVGVVLSGGQAAGGHNVISGLFDALKQVHPDSRLTGFLNGPSGIVDNETCEITESLVAAYRNQGGFDIIGSGRTKIETPEQFAAALKTAKTLALDGLVVIGGDDSNTNAALLAEYFAEHGQATTVVGAPKTIDGDLKNEWIEVSFGCDTACKTYSEIIGNIMVDARSAKKYYYFVKLMGRSASHVTLECALQTHPNCTLIGEEVAAKKMTVRDVTKVIADCVCARAEKGKNYGAVLIPEGIIEFIPEVKQLIRELNSCLAPDQPHGAQLEILTDKVQKTKYISKQLSEESAECYASLPEAIQLQLLLDRDPHGNVQVSKIETERLFIGTVKRELARRKEAGQYSGKFSAQPHFCGYEGRSCLPSNFDADYCYALGRTAALLVWQKLSGYMSCVRHLTRPTAEWEIAGIPLTCMMTMEERHGQPKPVIEKALTELDGRPFQVFSEQRKEWELEDCYRNPGPIQFFGPEEVTEPPILSLQLEHEQQAVR